MEERGLVVNPLEKNVAHVESKLSDKMLIKKKKKVSISRALSSLWLLLKIISFPRL